MAAFRATAKVDLDPLEKEQRAIERRRQEAANRRDRILDVKQRTIGIDVSALEQQLAEKEARQQAEHERDLELANEANAYARDLSRLEALRAAAKRRMNKDFSAYRQTAQPREARREWDLNDPDHLKKCAPMRTEKPGEPPTLGASSIQVFQGEDDEWKERKRYQQAQVKYWRDEKAAEVAAHAEVEKQAEREYAALSAEMAELSLAHEQNKAAILKRHGFLVGQDNAALVARKHTRLAQEAERDAEEAARDIATHSQSALLNEIAPPSRFGAHRVVPYAFKGMSADQKQAILDEVAHQQAAKQAAKRAEEEREVALAAEAETYRKLSLLKEREAQRAAHAKRQHVQQVILQQNAEKRASLEKLYRENFDLRPTEAYFNKFGTSAR